jgi:hypothetical protein
VFAPEEGPVYDASMNGTQVLTVSRSLHGELEDAFRDALTEIATNKTAWTQQSVDRIVGRLVDRSTNTHPSDEGSPGGSGDDESVFPLGPPISYTTDSPDARFVSIDVLTELTGMDWSRLPKSNSGVILRGYTQGVYVFPSEIKAIRKLKSNKTLSNPDVMFLHPGKGILDSVRFGHFSTTLPFNPDTVRKLDPKDHYLLRTLPVQCGDIGPGVAVERIGETIGPTYCPTMTELRQALAQARALQDQQKAKLAADRNAEKRRFGELKRELGEARKKASEGALRAAQKRANRSTQEAIKKRRKAKARKRTQFTETMDAVKDYEDDMATRRFVAAMEEEGRRREQAEREEEERREQAEREEEERRERAEREDQAELIGNWGATIGVLTNVIADLVRGWSGSPHLSMVKHYVRHPKNPGEMWGKVDGIGVLIVAWNELVEEIGDDATKLVVDEDLFKAPVKDSVTAPGLNADERASVRRKLRLTRLRDAYAKITGDKDILGSSIKLVLSGGSIRLNTGEYWLRLHLWHRIAADTRERYSKEMVANLFEKVKYGHIPDVERKPDQGPFVTACQREECRSEIEDGSRAAGVCLVAREAGGAEAAWCTIKPGGRNLSEDLKAKLSAPDEVIAELFDNGELLQYCSKCTGEIVPFSELYENRAPFYTFQSELKKKLAREAAVRMSASGH